MGGSNRGPPVEPALATVVIDHVLLSYLYLDEGDMDGYGSLLAEDAWLARPGWPMVTGRLRVQAELARVAGPPGRHRVHRIIPWGDRVVVRGDHTGAIASGCAHDVDFVDEISFSAEGLLLGQRRYYSQLGTDRF